MHIMREKHSYAFQFGSIQQSSYWTRGQNMLLPAQGFSSPSSFLSITHSLFSSTSQPFWPKWMRTALQACKRKCLPFTHSHVSHPRTHTSFALTYMEMHSEAYSNMTTLATMHVYPDMSKSTRITAGWQMETEKRAEKMGAKGTFNILLCRHIQHVTRLFLQPTPLSLSQSLILFSVPASKHFLILSHCFLFHYLHTNTQAFPYD